ncbi:T9SS type A sorting domain-containing protein [Tamlana fucoidanivorans]|uniref:T9SS type A sorting domain-containing protein n=1 Tax=Allotamlana fucoidanivorans TaxID=2583814 RepID=A0A5C4SFB1_9FLAO|nr:T9SS type A sorting domain-containing protein [Tamlana fucoidanivorans]TNJ42161.1 T9SS type A sorting domain-containing protein [Tamlana fucoidanivorans]
MINRIILFMILTSSLIGQAQLAIRNDAFVFVNDEIVFVEDDINLNEATSSIYLRNEAQVIQGTGTTGNSGVGKLSIQQNGTTNAYAYNYWCSPVGNTDASSNANRPYRFNTNMYDETSAPIGANLAGYTGGFNGSSAPLVISTRWLYSYKTGSSYADWNYIGSNYDLPSGYGFTMKGTNGSRSSQLYDFRGKPNNGDISVDVEAGKSTLVGNPYPSALDALGFIHAPINTGNMTGTLYFWEQDATVNSHYLSAYRGGYASYTISADGSLESYVPATFNSYNGDGTINTIGSPSSAGKTVKRYIPVGQGFMIEGHIGISGTQQVYFRNSQRVYEKESDGNSEFFKVNNSKAKTSQKTKLTEEGFPLIPTDYKRFRLNVDFNNTYTRQLLHNFHHSATPGFDYGLESKFSDVLNSDASWVLNEENYITQAHAFTKDLTIPLRINLDKKQPIKIRVADIQHFNTNQPIFLYDAELNKYFDLTTQDYSTILEAGHYNDRFAITFTQNTLSKDNFIANSFNVFQDNNLSELKIINTKRLPIKSISLYDITGKEVLYLVLNSAETDYTYTTKSLSDGVYVVTIQSESQKNFTKKVLISNSK